MSFWNKNKDEETMTMIPVLCKFWREDEVWNGSAEHLAVAVFGKTFEEAQEHLQSALVSHIECWIDAGKGEELLATLRDHARDYLAMSDIPADEPLVKMQIGMRNHEVFAAV